MTPSSNMPLFAQVRPHPARQPALAWGISLLVHALVFFWLWHIVAPHRADTSTGPARRIEVMLAPVASIKSLRPTTTAFTAPVAPSHPALPPVASAPELPLRPPRANLPLETPAASQAPALADTLPVTKPPNDGITADAPPAFDLAAARALARGIAREDSRAVVALSRGQDRMRATASDKLQERFEHARRADCLKAHSESMNLLANVVLLAKDMVANAVDASGCKW